MAIYKFRISFEDYDVLREIDIRSNQSFEDLHNAFHQSIGYKADIPSSFYISNDFWHKGTEITLFQMPSKSEKKAVLMSGSRLSNFIEDPHQKFYYTSNFDRPFDLHVELIRIQIEPDPKLTYPAITKTSGEPPKQFAVSGPVVLKPGEIPAIETEPEEFEEEDEVAEEADDYAIPEAEAIGEDDTTGLSEKEADEEETPDEEGFGDFEQGEDQDLHQGKEDY